jgi:hypothetical protein
MDQKSMARQVFDYQKTTFDSFIESVATIQDQAEKSLSFFLDKNPWLPEESKNVILEWGNIYKKGRDDFKQALDDGLDRMGSYFENAAEAAGQAAKKTAKSTEEAAKKASESHGRASESSRQESKQS